MRELPPAEIRSEVEKTTEKIWKMRFQAKGEPVENPGALRQLKKERARLLTVLREKELASAGAEQVAGAEPTGMEPAGASTGEDAEGAGGDA